MPASVKIAMVGMAVAMIGLGIVIEEIGEIEVVEVTEVIEMIAEHHDAILGVTTMTDHHEGTEIYSRVVWIEIEPEAVEGLLEVIGMNLRCRWVVERRAPVRLQRRRSLRLT